MVMTIREIRNELEEIYKERKSWDGAKGPFMEKYRCTIGEFVILNYSADNIEF